jgi:GNAT superfamily N-acetyltransferase
VSVDVREARLGDGAALARISIENARYYVGLFPDDFVLPTDPHLGDAIDESIASAAASETSIRLVAVVDGEVGAYVAAHIEEPEPARRNMLADHRVRRAYVDSLGTADAYQRRGLATRLVEAVEEWARGLGARVISAETHLDSPVSIPFWESRMGYRRRSVKLTKRL